MAAPTSLETDREATLASAPSTARTDDVFLARLDTHLPRLHDLLSRLYGDRADLQEHVTGIVAEASAGWNARPLELRARDDLRAAEPDWFQSERMLAGLCYVDRYAGNLAGVRDLVPSLRDLGLTSLHLLSLFESAGEIDPGLGTMTQLAELAADLRTAGISLVLDVALGGAEDADPAALRAIAVRLLSLANCGAEVLHVAVPAHLRDTDLILAALQTVCALAAPGVALSSGTPADRAGALSAGACELTRNTLQATLVWEALATRDGRLLQHALEERHALPPGAVWVNHVRDDDALAWSFPDEDAAALGLDPQEHRRFLARFYTGNDADSFARGVAVETGVAGTTASLAGIEAGDAGGEDRVVLTHALAMSTGGIPLLYLGDEVAQLNDYSFADDPARRDDARWVHRGNRPRDQYARRGDPDTPAGRVFERLTKLISVRQTTPELAGNDLIGFRTPHPSVIGYQRPGEHTTVLVLANVGDASAAIDPLTLSGFERTAFELVRGVDVDLDEGIALAPRAFTWLRVRPV